MNTGLISLYSDYLLCSNHQTTAGLLSDLTGEAMSHDLRY
jgi:hypothetical protein